jgi:predicted porin
MIGGLRGTASRVAIAAVFCVGAAVLIHKPAKAADLGGDCCADLEERVAELEATTVRKGNKKVTVIMYGKVNYATEWWDDGHEQNSYTVNNYNESTRFGFKGTAKINDQWSGGYRLELEIRPADSQVLNQFQDNNNNDPLGALNVRWSYIDLANKNYGEVRLGLTATPKYDVTKDTMEYISTLDGEGGGLSDTLVSDFRMNDGFFLRETGFNNAEGLSAGQTGGTALKWVNIARCYSAGDQFNCSTRRNGVAYSSPTWQGFTASVGEFEDDDFSAALRYRNTSWADTWLFAASVGYEKLLDERLQNGGGGLTGFRQDIDEWAGSAALKHKPTGLFVMGVFSTSESNANNVEGAFNGQGAPQMNAWNVQGGIQRKLPWFGLDTLGETAFWGGYSNVRNGFAPGFSGVNSSNDPVLFPATGGNLGTAPTMLLKPNTFPSIPFTTQITSSNVNEWFLGLDQDYSAAAMHVYLAYEHFNADLNLIDSSRDHVPLKLDSFDVIYSGARLYF